jgi:hypothetical protein
MEAVQGKQAEEDVQLNLENHRDDELHLQVMGWIVAACNPSQH